MISCSVEENRLEDVLVLLEKIPEFNNLPSREDIMARIDSVPYLVLTAYVDNLPVGFKIGYERDGRFYSWLGAVLPSYREQGIAALLASRQEEWARQHGYKTIWMKTRNCFPEMLMMAIGRGFIITGYEPKEEISQHRIVLEKSL